jgi:hypothetical protein
MKDCIATQAVKMSGYGKCCAQYTCRKCKMSCWYPNAEAKREGALDPFDLRASRCLGKTPLVNARFRRTNL